MGWQGLDPCVWICTYVFVLCDLWPLSKSKMLYKTQTMKKCFYVFTGAESLMIF